MKKTMKKTKKKGKQRYTLWVHLLDADLNTVWIGPHIQRPFDTDREAKDDLHQIALELSKENHTVRYKIYRDRSIRPIMHGTLRKTHVTKKEADAPRRELLLLRPTPTAGRHYGLVLDQKRTRRK